MTNRVGVLDGGGEAWGVRIPDIPGCVGGSRSSWRVRTVSLRIDARRES
ncbi:hypothetical protein [Roseiarcus sp.]